MYTTLDLLDLAVKAISENWDNTKKKPENQIGTLKDCLAYTLSVDIDSIKGPNGENITNSPEIKKAVEDAGQFFVNYLREHEIKKSVHCLYSGGGIYVHVHHGLFRTKAEWTPEDREQAARSLTIAYNALIAEISKNFFEHHPEHEGRVKFDRLNNQKRKFKVIFSIHKTLGYAVIPLNPDHIEIDFDRAKLPLIPDVLVEGEQWYQSYDLKELPRLKEILAPFKAQAEEELKERKARTGSYEISRFPKPLAQESWPPCMKNIIEKVSHGKGPHRALAVLASWLYQAGWNEDKAFELWEPLADRVNVEGRIFDCWHGLMSCSSCAKIQKESGGYPKVGLGGLGYCEPDENCNKWPGDYGHCNEDGKNDEDNDPFLSIDEIKSFYEEDHDRLLDPKVLRKINQLSQIKFHDFCKELKLDSAIIKILKIELAKLNTEASTEKETFDSDTLDKARIIAECGDSLKFMLNTFNKTHKGDRLHAEAQFIAFGVQSAYNTKGVFETWGGPSGKGKSDGAKACIRQLPSEYAIVSSITAKSLYYRNVRDLIPDGAVLFLDDKNIETGSDLEETLKRIQTFFQEGAEHETLDGQRNLLRTKLSKRLLVVRTYVDSIDTDSQLLNRSLDLGVDSSEQTDKEVCDLVLALGEEGQNTDMITRQTLICRALWQDIKSHVYRVKTPASIKIVKFTDVSNRRNPSLFLDLVIGLACIRHKQRDKEAGANGETILYAAFEDYLEAARLFNSQAKYLSSRLDETEQEAVGYIQSMGDEGASLVGLSEHLIETFPNDGWNTQRVRRLMAGRKERNYGVLLDKVPGIMSFYDVRPDGSKHKRYKITDEKELFTLQVVIEDPREKIDHEIPISQISHLFPIMGKRVVKDKNNNYNNNNNNNNNNQYPRYPKKKSKDNSNPFDQKKSPKNQEKFYPHDFGKNGKSGKGGTPKEPIDIDFPFSQGGKGMGNRPTLGPNPKKDIPTSTTDQEKRCLACGYPTGFGHGSYVNGLFCSTCGPKLPMVESALKANPEFSLSELWEDLAARGRPPMKEHLLAMIQYLKEAGSREAVNA